MANVVQDNVARQRYELNVEGGLAFIDYRRDGSVVALVHAEVPVPLQGRGLGSQLARGTLELVRARGERVIPICPFIVDYLARHPEFRTLVAPRG